MSNIKIKLQKIFKDKNIYIFTLITILFFGIFCIPQFSLDTYSVFSNGVKESTLHFLKNGRIITAIFNVLSMRILKLGYKGTYVFSYILAIIFTIASLYKLNKLIQKEVKNDLISILITTILIINPFSIELFIYIEKSVMMFSILLCVMAIEHMIKFFEGNNKSILFALILMFLANSSYQGTVGFFVTISLFYILKYSKNWKSFLKNNILVALVYAVSAILNLAFIKLIFKNQRISGEKNISESLKKIFIETRKMFLETYNILPKYFFISILLIIVLYIIYKTVTSKYKSKEKIINMLELIYIIIGTTAVAVLPQMLQNTNEIWFAARSSYSLAALIGMLLLYLYSKYSINIKERNITIFMIILFLIIQFIGFMRTSIGNYTVNALDKEVSLKIKDMTEKYEKESGNKIDSISIYNDKNMRYTYEDIPVSKDVNIKAYSIDWATLSILRFYLKRNLNMVERDAKLEKEFNEIDWERFDKKQIIFDKNIMHICLY